LPQDNLQVDEPTAVNDTIYRQFDKRPGARASEARTRQQEPA